MDAIETSALSVRRLTVDDLADYRALHRHGLRESPLSFVENVADDEARDDEVVRAMLARDEGWGVFSGARLLGKLVIDTLGFAVLAHTRWLHAIYVHPDARGTGASQALLRAAIDDARSQGARRFLLWVSANNAGAKTFYAKLGFVEIGRVPQGLVLAGTEVDDILMCLSTS